MASCYLLTVCCGSSLDQQSNNVTLFNLVEQIQVPHAAPPPPNGLIPLEIHAYFAFAADELNRHFDVRYVLVADSGLETFTAIYSHKPTTARLRTRTLGVPFPPVPGRYSLHADLREANTESWTRAALGWPLSITRAEPRPRVTH